MKRIIKIASELAVVAALASCAEKETPISGSKEVPGGQSEAVVPTEIVASFEATKVSYAEVGDADFPDLQPSWEVGDEVIALSDDGKESYTLTVETVTDNSATLIGEVPASCKLHLIFCPGVSADELTVDYTAQTGAQDTMPAVMLSDGEVKKGAGKFTFRNAGAIIGISAVNGVPSGATISKITVEGENLAAATVTLDGSSLKLAATPKTGDAISTATLSGITTTDDNGTLSRPVFIAVPAGAVIAKVIASVAAREPEEMKIPSTAADKKNIDYVEIAAKYDGTNVTTKKWAKWNVGASSQSEYGWYFAWGGTKGYVFKNDQWVSASGVDSYSYTLSSAKTAVACDYLYVKTQNFITAGYSFYWAHAPFNNGSSDYDEDYFNEHKSEWITEDNILKPEYDAAHVNWGGTWRMPTSAEFKAMKDVTYWAWDSDDKGHYGYAPNPATDAGKYNNGTGTYSKESALLFFPAAGRGYAAGFYNTGFFGHYWSSSLHSSLPDYAYFWQFYNDNIDPQSYSYRCSGYSVRPVSD